MVFVVWDTFIENCIRSNKAGDNMIIDDNYFLVKHDVHLDNLWHLNKINMGR